MQDLIADLVAEQAAVERALTGLDPDRWDVPSPAEGWTLRDCVAHLAEIDHVAATIAVDRHMPRMSRAAPGDPLSAGQREARTLSSDALFSWWREGRERLAAALSPLDPRDRLPWFGPPMSARSFATARLMESWSHGLDIHDAAGRTPADTDRLRHVAHLGYVTREFAYRNRGLAPPTTPLYVELTAPSGATWTFGPPDAPDLIHGPAGDFCRVVTQRLHPADTSLITEGERASEFLRVAQAFAGPPGAGRPPKGR